MATFKINGKNFATQDGTGAATVHSDVVFPTGHVLQVVQNESTETNTLTTSFANLYEVNITLKSASSDVYGFFYFDYYGVASSGFGVKIYRNNSATVTTSHTAVWTKNTTSSTGPYTWFASGNAIYGAGTINPKDSLSGFSIGDTLYYGLFARKTDSDNVEIGYNTHTDGFISSTLMEVQK